MRRKLLLIFGLIVFGLTTHAQNSALELGFDNDYLTDRYYTAGFQISFVRGVKQSNWMNSFLAHPNKPTFSTNYSLDYGFQIYTPFDHEEEDLINEQHDRPFAGWQYLSMNLDRFIGKGRVNQYHLTLGVVGPDSGMGNLQKSFHDLVDFKYPYGWENQIVNEFVINIGYSWTKEWIFMEEIGLGINTNIELGTGSNRMGQGFHVRIGKINPLQESGFLSPRTVLDKVDQKESYFLAGVSLDYVASNIFLEGSLFDNRSPFTVDAKPFVWESFFGLMFSSSKSNFSLTTHVRGPEVEVSKAHIYFKAKYGFSI
ncbi:MAG: lipid A deacylase LpxR family protein [Bacteroidia bacterium]|nr:lipid A deacylase LpxR family protein [Bacteroidia bacterium]